uniref:Glycosyltransferase family 92 protein n=1 Tax=Haemonchus contortus TaxID=6289 RepID=A0A7I4Y5Z9_HAECO
MGVINISDVKTMRSRLARKLLAFVVAFTVAIPLFRFFSWDEEPKQTHIGSAANKTPRRSLIEKSVLLRYSDTDPLTIFSAYSHSDRTTVIIAAYGYMMRRLFCRLFDDQFQEILPATQTLVFPEFTIHCPPSNHARFVSLSLNAFDAVTLQDMHKIRGVRESGSKGEKSFLSVCLAPLWGTSPKWLLLIEFIEYYRLQGVEYFYVYRQSSDTYSDIVLNDYENEGILEIVNINETTNCLKRHRCRHEMQLQDCVFRTRGRSDWVATVDLDERISVNGGSTVESMGVHQVLRFSPGTTVRLVPPEDAVVRHYRLTKGWAYFLKEAETFGSFEDTHVAPELLKALQLAVNDKVNKLFPESKTKVSK